MIPGGACPKGIIKPLATASGNEWPPRIYALPRTCLYYEVGQSTERFAGRNSVNLVAFQTCSRRCEAGGGAGRRHDSRGQWEELSLFLEGRALSHGSVSEESRWLKRRKTPQRPPIVRGAYLPRQGRPPLLASSPAASTRATVIVRARDDVSIMAAILRAKNPAAWWPLGNRGRRGGRGWRPQALNQLIECCASSAVFIRP